MMEPRGLLVMPIATLYGGAERMLLNLATAASRAGPPSFDVAFLQPGPMIRRLRERSVRAFSYDAKRLRNLPRMTAASVFLYNVLRSGRYDYVLSWMDKGHFYAGIPARAAGIPAAYFYHLIPGGGRIERAVNWIPHRHVYVPSKIAARAHKKLVNARDAVSVLYPGVDLDDLSARASLVRREDMRARLGIAGDVLVIGAVARLEPRKNIDFAIRAYADFRRRYPNSRFLVAGDAHDRSYHRQLVDLIDGLGLTGSALLLGHVDNAPAYIRSLDMFVHAAYDEPSSVAVREAIALGIPSVISRSGGTPEFVPENVCAFIDGRDPSELTSTLLDLASDESRRTELGTRGAAYGQSRFGSDAMLAAYAESLRSWV
jgi:glycosyltransferase involved in cell wall biosynthesis